MEYLIKLLEDYDPYYVFREQEDRIIKDLLAIENNQKEN